MAGPAKTSAGQQQPHFAVRIVYIDYYTRKPVSGLDVTYSQLQGTAIEQVPVVRVFGSTPSGQKTCVHIHKVRNQALASLFTNSRVPLSAHPAGSVAGIPLLLCHI